MKRKEEPKTEKERERERERERNEEKGKWEGEGTQEQTKAIKWRKMGQAKERRRYHERKGTTEKEK